MQEATELWICNQALLVQVFWDKVQEDQTLEIMYNMTVLLSALYFFGDRVSLGWSHFQPSCFSLLELQLLMYTTMSSFLSVGKPV